MNHYLGAELSDGTVTLRPLQPVDAADHLAGEDAELVRWLNGGPGTPETVSAHIQRVGGMWAADGPIFGFGIRAVPGDILAGTIDIHLHQPYASEDQANLAFGLYPVWRGRGLATRAVLLGVEFLRERTSIDEALIRVDPANRASFAVARRAGFQHVGTVHEDSGELAWFTRNVRQEILLRHEAGYVDGLERCRTSTTQRRPGALDSPTSAVRSTLPGDSARATYEVS